MILDRKTPPVFKTINDVSFPWPMEMRLNTSIPLYVLEQGKLPIIKLSLLFTSGSWHDPQNGIAYFTTKMLLEGTKDKNSHQIAAYIDHYGASIGINTRADYWSIEVVSLSKHFVSMLELLTEILVSPIFPAAQLNLLQHLKTQEIKIEDEKNSQISYKRFKEALLGRGHPYGYSLTAADIQVITRDHLLAYYQQQLFSGCQVLLSGQVTDLHIQSVQTYLSFLKLNQTTRPNHPLPIKSPSKIHVPKEGSLQSAICIGKVLFPKTHPDYLAMSIVTELLGGYFGSRLMRNIREEKGYTYNIHASMLPLKEATYFFISTEAIQESAEQTCREIYREIKSLQTTDTPLDELITLRNYMIGNFLASINDPFSIMRRFQEAHLHGLGQAFYLQFYNTLQTITPSKIKEIATAYLSLDSLTEIRVG